eukprot:899210-Pleurochrysis_carterae.AAC.2
MLIRYTRDVVSKVCKRRASRERLSTNVPGFDAMYGSVSMLVRSWSAPSCPDTRCIYVWIQTCPFSDARAAGRLADSVRVSRQHRSADLHGRPGERCKENSSREFIERIHRESSSREFIERIHRENSSREFIESIHRENSWREFIER